MVIDTVIESPYIHQGSLGNLSVVLSYIDYILNSCTKHLQPEEAVDKVDDDGIFKKSEINGKKTKQNKDTHTHV